MKKRTGGIDSPALADTLWLALFLSCGFAAQGQISLPIALNTTNLTWTTGGNALWHGQAAYTHDGVAAAQSGAIGDSPQESWLQTTITNGPGNVAFCWKVSSEGDCDLLQFYIGASVAATISGGVDWQRVSFRIPAGVQTLKWRYSKDGGTACGLDAGFVDEVLFIPDLGPPVVMVQTPSRRTVIAGVPVTFFVSVGGNQTLSYQWRLNGADVAGATTATNSLPSVTLAQAGSYQVVVTNAYGSVTSSPSVLVATNLNAIATALVLVDGPSPSPYVSALQQMNLPYQLFTDEGNFAIAVDHADPATCCAIVDSYWTGQNLSSVLSFVKAGGRAIVQYWMLAPNSPIGITFGSPYVGSLPSAAPVYIWASSPIFDGISSPIAFTDLYQSDGVKINPAAPATGVAGFTPSFTWYQCAMIVGNSNRTILDGFLIEEVTSSTIAVQLARNQINFLSAPPGPPVITMQPQNQTVVSHATGSFAVAASGSPAPGYRWLFNNTNFLVGATNSVLQLPSVTFTQSGTYRAVATNISGAVTSSPAVLTVLSFAPVTNALLLVDGPQYSAFDTALFERGEFYQRYNDVASFNTALATADLASTLAIADITINYIDLTPLADFATRGGRSIMECWNLATGPVAAAFQASVSQTIVGQPPPLYNWNSPDLFTNLPNPIYLYDNYVNNGVMLQPLTGALAVAGFTPSPAPGHAAIVLGNRGFTLVNGFLGEDTDVANAVILAGNEIDLISTLQTLQVSGPSCALGISSNQFGFQLIGHPGQTVVVEASSDLQNWVIAATLTINVGPTYFSDPSWSSYSRRFYRLRSP